MTENTTKKPKINQSKKVTHVIALDVESTGMNLIEHWMPEFGASLWRIGEAKPQQTFYRLLEQPAGTGWCAKTKAEFWDNPDKGYDKKMAPMVHFQARCSASTAVSPKDAMNNFIDWVQAIGKECTTNGWNVIIITDTAAYDTAWINYYLSKYTSERCAYLGDIFGEYRPTRDISAFYFGVGRCLKKHGSTELALEKIGADAPMWVTSWEHNHHPLSDANSIGAMASFILSHFHADN